MTRGWRRQRWLAPEVVQTSAMDCGPASLKCLLEGFGVHASYGRLREACQTDVDGTSIDTIEDIAVQLGLDATQVMVPIDHVLLSEAALLPAIAVVRLPSGVTHFAVVWRRHGPVVQLMDPATGRRWSTTRQFLDELYVHETTVPASTWREWAAEAETLAVVRKRLALAGVPGETADRVLAHARADQGWRPLAAADAAARMTRALVRSGATTRGTEAGQLFERVYTRSIERPGQEQSIIPTTYWSAHPASAGVENVHAPDIGGADEQILFRGAVLVSVRGLKQATRTAAGGQAGPSPRPLTPELAATLDEPPIRPWRTLVDLARADGVIGPFVLLSALALSAAGVIVEALLLRSLFNIGSHLALTWQRVTAMASLAALVGGLLLIDWPIALAALRLGRRLEIRLRMAFLQKIPRLGDRYLQSRPTSDMAERSHSIHQIRALPDLGAQMARAFFELTLTAIAIAWIDPASGPVAALSAGVALALPFAVQPVLRERDLRVRTHTGALGRFYLDTLLGLVTVRAHTAETAIRREHEALLVDWARAGFGLQRAVVAVEGAQLVAGFGLAVWLLFDRLGRGGDPGSALLLAYWALNLPVLGQDLAHAAWQYPGHRNLTLRLIEPLGALEEPGDSTIDRRPPTRAVGDGSRRPRPGVMIQADHVSVRAAGHTILHDVSLAIPAGTHVAIVGASGAGKSSFVGLLLGWHRPATGSLVVDGEPLDRNALDRLRRETAWVDPTVQLWNRTLLENVQYGSGGGGASLTAAINAADLREVLERLPEGLQTMLGEGGGLISGGEAQRVRLARGGMRENARLVILDEPFRGLERDRRREFLHRARILWRDATMLCITHDVSETLAFDRVLVVAEGRIVEDGRPATLAVQPDSRYHALLEGERIVREELWNDASWRRLLLKNGRLVDTVEEMIL